MTGECILPTHHYLDKDGYPRLKYQSRFWRGNRLIWTLCFGEIPKNSVVAHKCNNKGCMNPQHLYVTSTQQNSADAAKDGLYKSGDKHHKTRWSDKDILEMAELYDTGFTQSAIGASFGISQSRVSECIKRARKLGDNR